MARTPQPNPAKPGGALIWGAILLGLALAAKGCAESVERGTTAPQYSNSVPVPVPSAQVAPTPPVAP